MDITRIMDAEFNRAREALRGVEDYARFALEDRWLATAAKGLRHELTSAVLGHFGSHLPLSRDMVSDPGRGLEREEEYERADAAHVAGVACGRLTEALRSLEEYGKTTSIEFARKMERLRYSAYDLQSRLERTGFARKALAGWRLYVLVTESLCRRDWLATAEEVLRAGVEAVQLREKMLPDGELLRRARALREKCESAKGMLFVNDRPDMALLSGAAGVHVGQGDLPIREVRRVMNRRGCVGVSTHTLEQARAAAGEGPDYLAVGPMYESETKPRDFVAGPGTLEAVARECALPLVAIGGITLERVDEVLAAAPRACICVCQDIVADKDPGEKAATYLEKIEALHRA